jgi:cell division septation protein DedD
MTVRDAERFKDKIEVSLDTRQVFFLFFGGAVIACLVFVLGVMVGKRLESRERVARKAATSAQIDPLAALDELGADEPADDKGEDLALASALVKPAKAAAEPAAKREAGEKGGGAEKPADKVAEKADKPEKPADKVAEKADKPEKPADKVADKSADKDKPKDAKKDREKDKDKDKEHTKFTLQISSFQERAEADALLARLTAGGYKPFIVMSNVPDKGVFFRVRIGEYPSKADALDAKAEFEKKQHLLAYVTKI